jgi:hypothetical protein
MRGRLDKPEQQATTSSEFSNWKGTTRRIRLGGDFYDHLESRLLSLTPTPRLCIDRYKIDVASTPWEIVPLIEEGRDSPTDEAIAHAKQIWEWLYYKPNYNNEPLSQIFAKTTDDLCTHDAGVFLKLYGQGGGKRLVELHAKDADDNHDLHFGRIFANI